MMAASSQPEITAAHLDIHAIAKQVVNLPFMHLTGYTLPSPPQKVLIPLPTITTARKSPHVDLHPFRSATHQLLSINPPPNHLLPAILLISIGGVEISVNDLVNAHITSLNIQPEQVPVPPPPGTSTSSHATTNQPPLCQPSATPVDGLSSSEAVAVIMSKVDASMRSLSFFTTQISKIGAQLMWRLAEQAGDLWGAEYTAQGELRTKCGILMRLVKKAKTEGRAAESLPPVEEIRAQPLFPHQQQVLARIWASGRSVNWVVVAPTGTGKTRIFVEYSRMLQQACPTTKVVVLVPNVALTAQHAHVFNAHGISKVGSFYSDSPLNGNNWGSNLREHDVLVATAQCLVNVVNARGAAVLSEIDLLVIDEAHHTHKDHPYNLIMAAYRTLTTSTVKTPQVLGFTASPGASTTLTGTTQVVTALASNLHAQIQVVNEGDATVQQIAPSPSEYEEFVNIRPEDLMLATQLRDFVLQEGDVLAGSIARLYWNKKFSLPGLPSLSPFETVLTIQQVTAQAGALTNWLTNSMGICNSLQAWDQLLCCQLLKIVVRSYDLIPEIGYEAVVAFLGKRLYQLLVEFRSNRLTEGLTGNSEGQVSMQDMVVDVDVDVAERPRKQPRLEGSRISSDLSSDQIVAALMAATFKLPSDLETPELDALTERLLTGTSLGNRELVEAALGLSINAHPPFPRLQALTSFLLTHYSQCTEFHGIVFVATRAGAYLLAEALASNAGPGFLDEVLVFTGHREGKRQIRHGVVGLVDVADNVKGLSASQQKGVLARFKQPGRRLLIATSAAEEGIDVQSCELVVRYSAAATGVQRVQSRGRGRKVDAKFLTIVLHGTADWHLHHKSKTEEANMSQYLQMLVGGK